MTLQSVGRSSGRAFKDVGLLPLAYWDCGFESHSRLGCLSLVRVVRCQLEVFVSAYHSSRGFLPSVVCLSVIVKPR